MPDLFSQRLLVLFLVFIPVERIQASVIEFQHSPNVIKRGLTDTLDLSCSLNDSAASSSVIGRRDVSLDVNSDVTQTPDVTQTAQNVAQVSSIIIMSKGQDLAAISHSNPASILDGSSNGVVAGSVSGSTGSLHLSYQTPTDSQTGEFLCQVNATSKTGHVISFSKTVEVKTMAPTIADLVQAIQEMKMKENSLKNELNNLKTQIGTAVFFSAGISTHLLIHPRQTVKYDQVFSNVGAGYDPTTGIFTCPFPGSYKFSVNALSDKGYGFGLSMHKNGVGVAFRVVGHAQENLPGHSATIILKLDRGDKIDIYSWLPVFSQLDPSYNFFTGELIFSQ